MSCHVTKFELPADALGESETLTSIPGFFGATGDAFTQVTKQDLKGATPKKKI